MILPILEIGVFLLLSIFIGLLLREYLKLHSKLERLTKERVDVEYRARQRAVQLVEEARTKAEEILQKAAAKAFAEEKDITDELDQIGKQQQEMYKQMLQNISKSVEDQAVREFKGIKLSIETDTLDSTRQIKERLQQQYDQAVADLENFKQERLREIKQTLAEMVIDISRNLVGKSMSNELQMELVDKQLKEAKIKYGL